MTCLLPVTRLTVDGTDFGWSAAPDGYDALNDGAPRAPHKKDPGTDRVKSKRSS